MTRSTLILMLLCAPLLAGAQDRSADYRETYQRQALAIYRDTIAMRTALGHGQVPVMAHYLADRFRDAGFDADDIHVLPLVLPNGEEVASLVVRWPSKTR